MTTEDGTGTEQEQFLNHLRDALNHLYEPHRLSQNPLADVFGVANRFDTASALRRIVVEAIEALKPSADEPLHSPARQIYGALLYRYVEQMPSSEAADQLNLSVRHLSRRQRDGLEALAEVLCERFEIDTAHGQIAPIEPDSPTDVNGAALSEELAWLRDTRRTTDLTQVLSGTLNLALELADRFSVQLETQVPDRLPRVAADPVIVRQILLNLLSLAIRRASQGCVTAQLQLRDGEIEFHVQCAEYPTGPKPELDDETISLNMIQRLVELCGGQLTLAVDSRCFDATVVLPGVGQLPVLVIDDNLDTLELMQRYASGTRYRILAAQSPQEGLALAERLSPQVIVLDVMMPKVDGWEVLSRLQSNPVTRLIPIIVCTILPQQEWARFLGASDIIHKPITREVFLAALDRHAGYVVPESN